MIQPENGGFGIYLHWPFCEAKCPYCDFNSYVSKQVDFDLWETAFLSELDRLGQGSSGHLLRSVFFGGGTPSLMPPTMVAKILDKISQIWRFTNDVEITLEANPSSVETARFQDFQNAGINRVSLGVQALDDASLRKLGRVHSVAQALAALEIAAATFDRFSFDLIYARQNQTVDDWATELGTALSFGAKHMSLYQLTIEPETVFGQRAAIGKLPDLPDHDQAADMFELTQTLCAQAGLPAYEISNHAAAGQESRHNLIYWSGGEFLGIGPGAHGRVTQNGARYATETWLAPNKWLDHAIAGNGESKRTLLSGAEQADEYLMMGLRKKTGISISVWEKLTQRPLTIPNDLMDHDLVRTSKGQLIATDKGQAVLNHVIQELLTSE